LNYEPSERYNGVPAVRWCGLEVPRLWRCGNRGNVASVLIEKPAIGDFLPILEGGFSLQYSPLLEYREGQGIVLFCQLDVTGRTADDPATTRLVRNLLQYASTARIVPERKVSFMGDEVGKRYLRRLGIDADWYQGGELPQDHVLVVDPAADAVLRKHAPAIRRWLNAGGHLLALQLDSQQANLVSPQPIRTKRTEHIAAFFEPPPAGSLFAGICPADVHNRDPRELPLVTEGAEILGNGVLARLDNANAVLCQIVPYQFYETVEKLADAPGADGDSSDYVKHNLRRTFRRSSLLVSRLLANQGVRAATPLLSRFASPVTDVHAESLLANGDLATDSDQDGTPDRRELSKDMTQCNPPTQGRWLEGLYVDRPLVWDDPYRFFRW
jgi:hypothetical protein